MTVSAIGAAPAAVPGGRFRLGKSVVLIGLAGLVALIILYPLGALIIASLGPGVPNPLAEVGPLQGYVLLFKEFDLLVNTMVISVGSTLLALFFGVSLAWITTRTNIPYARTLEQLILIPFYMTPLIGAVAWVMLASPGQSGLVNGFLMSVFGLSDGLFNIYTPGGIIWVMGIYYAPFCYLFAAGALKSMEPALEECSTVMGGGILHTARRVTIPLIMPAILGSLLLVFVLSVGQFGVPAVIGMPRGYHVLTTRIYQYVAGFDPNYAAAAAMGLSLLIFAAAGVTLQFKFLGKRSFTTVTGRGFRPRRIDVKFWRIPLFLVACFYVLVSVVLPLGTLVWASLLKWITSDVFNAKLTLDNYRYILFEYPTTSIAIKNSIILAVGGACIVIGISVLVAWMLQRTQIRGRRLLEYVVMIPLGVPGIVFSIGLLWAWVRFPFLDIYGTIWILLIAFITIFLPYGVRAISSTLVQIDRSLEECASVLGASWGRVMRTITFPLLAPGIWAGWTLILVSIIKELSAPALLYNSKTVVLSVAVFDLYVSGSFTYVATLSLIQALILFVILFLARRLGGARGISIG